MGSYEQTCAKTASRSRKSQVCFRDPLMIILLLNVFIFISLGYTTDVVLLCFLRLVNGVVGGAIVIIEIINEAVGIVAVMLCYFFVNG